MARLGWVHVDHVQGRDTAKYYSVGTAPLDHMVLDLPGNVTLSFDGLGAESEANLLGFLDQMHSIRNALIQDIADRVEAVK